MRPIPNVSVILPTRNRATTLRAAIDSVLSQEAGELELIVIDDGSTDRTGEVLASVDSDSLRVIVLDRSVGAAAARNIGVRSARADVLGFQDSDDIWCRGSLASLLSALRVAPPDVAVAYGTARPIDESTGTSAPPPGETVTSGDLRGPLCRYNFVTLPASVVRIDAFNEVGGFDERLPRLQDWDLFLRVSQRWRFVHVPQVVVMQGGGADRISRDERARLVALRRILRTNQDGFRMDEDALLAYQAQLARLGVRHLDMGAIGAGMAGMIKHPRGAARWLAGRLRGHPSHVARR